MVFFLCFIYFLKLGIIYTARYIVYIDDLNKEQQEAVKTTSGPLLVLAGAGSGKTKVLTTRIAYLINEAGVMPSNILAITFTNKAAKEMKSRVYKQVGDLANFIQVSTFHAFGLKIIRENAKLLGYESNFVILDSDDSLSVIKKILKEKDIDPKIFNPKAIKNKISSSKNELISPEAYSKFAIGEFEKITLDVYKRYEAILAVNNSVDFDDLLLLPIKLFKLYPDILEKYQERYQYILIDEYQDTNEAQYKLTKMLSSKYSNICCVGDNDQSIYSFRGANYRNIMNFEKDFPNAKVIKLEQNYRSTANILNSANAVIKNNRERKDKNLWTDKGDGQLVTYYRARSEQDESNFVVNEIVKIKTSAVMYNNIAVIYRTNAQSSTLEKEFVTRNIPYKVVGGTSFYSRKEIKDLLAYLRIILNAKDNISLTRVINVPKRGIGTKSLTNLAEAADKKGISMFEAIDGGKEQVFKDLIESLRKLSSEVSLTELIEAVISSSGMRTEYKSERSLEADIRLENLEEFKSITQEFENRDGVTSLEDFLMEISLLTDINEFKEEQDQVNLMTIHSAKGLEFDYVFVVGLEEGIFPHINSLLDSKELEEERRLCYVALTRAKHKLYIVNARRRMLFGREQINPPSRFITEIGDATLEKSFEEEKVETVQVREEMYHEEELTFEVGEFVYHDIFGAGKVVEVGDKLISIAFKHPYGIKKLLKNHKSINKM